MRDDKTIILLQRELLGIATQDASEAFQEEVLTPLLQESGSVLHYYKPEQREQMLKEEGLKLQTALRELGIEPFTGASVTHYKRKVASQKNFPRKLCIALGLVACLGCLARVIFLSVAGGLDAPFPVLWYVSLVFVYLVTVFGILKTDPWTWRRTALSAYGEQVSEPALAIALSIRKKLESASFQVEYLSKKERAVPGVDPFLVVLNGPREYYVDVWDESMFNPSVVLP
jgi:hypothetical protein